MSAGVLCGERSSLTGGGDGAAEWTGVGGGSTSHFISVSQSHSDWTSLFSVNELPPICS